MLAAYVIDAGEEVFADAGGDHPGHRHLRIRGPYTGIHRGVVATAGRDDAARWEDPAEWAALAYPPGVPC